jgi:hypothetical protein
MPAGDLSSFRHPVSLHGLSVNSPGKVALFRPRVGLTEAPNGARENAEVTFPSQKGRSSESRQVPAFADGSGK